MWKLIYINRYENETISFEAGTLAECLATVPTLVQNDADMIEAAREDLTRIGARYHEFVGGTLVIASVDL